MHVYDHPALTGVAQLVRASPIDWKVTDSIPIWGTYKKGANQCFSHISVSFSLSPSLLLQFFKKVSSGEDKKYLTELCTHVNTIYQL